MDSWNLWVWILGAAVLCYALKLAGYLIPAEKLESPRILRVAGVITIGLLASLTVVNAFADGQELRVDARLAALVAGGVALALKAPYIVVVIVGAVAAAAARLLGMA